MFDFEKKEVHKPVDEKYVFKRTNIYRFWSLATLSKISMTSSALACWTWGTASSNICFPWIVFWSGLSIGLLEMTCVPEVKKR